MNRQPKIVFGILFLVVAFVVQANEELDTASIPLADNSAAANESASQPAAANELTGETIIDPTSQQQTPPPDNQPPEAQRTEEENASQNAPLQESTIPQQPTVPPKKETPPTSNAITGQEYGETWDKLCSGSTCVHTFYPYQKYYQSKSNWLAIDETFYSTNCRNNYYACVTDNLYEAHITSSANQSDAIFFSRNNSFFIFAPQQVQFKQTASSRTQAISTIKQSPAQISKNTVQYPASFGSGIDIQFQYLPRMFKEEIILQTNSSLPPATLTTNRKELTVDLEFKVRLPATADIIIANTIWNKQTPATTQGNIKIVDGVTAFYLAQPIAYDAKSRMTQATYTLENRGNGFYLTLSVPYAWLMNETRVYPVVIDPTITLDDTDIIWDGNVNYEAISACPEEGPCNNPWRISTRQNITVGDDSNWPDLGSVYHRGDIDWNISSIPNHAKIATAELILYGEQAGMMNDNMRFSHMHGGNSYYVNNDSGNLGFYNDISNGTQYLNQTFAGGENRFNLTKHPQLKIDLENTLKNNTDVWSIGFRSNETGTADAIPAVFTSSEGANASRRPQLRVVYTSTKPTVVISTPFSGKIFDKIGTIVINVTVGDADNDFLTVHLFGSNSSQPAADDVLARLDNVTAGTSFLYNWTAPVTDASTATKLLFHLDKEPRFGETTTFFYDFSGNGNNGSCSGTSCPAVAQSGGKLANAFTFDGINDAISLPAAASLNIATNITMVAWIKTTFTGLQHIVGGYQASDPYQGYGFATGIPYLLPGRIAYWSGAHGAWVGANTTIADGQWHHVAVSVAGNVVTFSVDGRVDNIANSSAPNSYAGTRSIGARSTGDQGFNGTLDEVQIYSTALSQEDIMNLYRLQSGQHYFWANVTDGIEDAQTPIFNFTLYADEFEGELSIEKGIRAILGLGAPLFRDIQVYTRRQTTNQQLGRFDRYTASATKRWGFNYITDAEAFANLNNVSTTIYFSEMINLTGVQITQHVQTLINATI